MFRCFLNIVQEKNFTQSQLNWLIISISCICLSNYLETEKRQCNGLGGWRVTIATTNSFFSDREHFGFMFTQDKLAIFMAFEFTFFFS